MMRSIIFKFNNNFFLIVIFTFICLHECYALHYYNIAKSIHEPRLERPWLTTFSLPISYARATHAYDKQKEKVALFDMYGAHPMQSFIDGLCKDFNDDIDLLLLQLALLPSNTSFATFSIDGVASITEIMFAFVQNFEKGFFLEVRVPFKLMNSKDITFNDLSLEDRYPNNKDPLWVQCKKNFQSIMNAYGIDTASWDDHGCGDSLVMLGWTMSYQDTEEIDFIDLTVRGGVLLPTSKKTDLTNMFALPFGYGGHVGLPLDAAITLGCYEWLTLGINLNALFFISKSHDDIKMKITDRQSPLFLIKTDKANVDLGTVWAGAGFIKADHFIQGFSFTCGYTFTHQKRTYVRPVDQNVFLYSTVNNDNRFAGFTAHTIHFIAEYDFTDQNKWYGPHISFGFHKQVKASNVFEMYAVTGALNLELAWDYN